MNIRPTQATTFALIKSGLFKNFGDLVHAQQQIASGKRILRPSDDPIGSAQASLLRGRLAAEGRFVGAISSGRNRLDTASTALQGASGLIAEARELTLEGMNGFTSAGDRQLMAGQIELIRNELIEIANRQLGQGYLFGGTATNAAPFVVTTAGGREAIVYRGNDAQQDLLVAEGTVVGANLPGSEIFTTTEFSGTSFGQLTGAAPGTSPDLGTGYDYLELRHDSTSATFTSGVALASGGALDTILGDHVLTIDATAGTVQLDNGVAVTLPGPGDPALADFTVTNEHGAEVHLDFTAYTGVDETVTLTGNGSASLDGTNWTALDFIATDLELIDAGTGAVVHLDTTGIHRAGSELVVFGGTVNLFDDLQAIAETLRNSDGLPSTELGERLNLLLDELDRGHEGVITAMGVLGSRSQRLTSMEAGYEGSEVMLSGLLANIEDVDFGEVVLDMTRAEQTLQLTQATAARLLQNSLLNFIR